MKEVQQRNSNSRRNRPISHPHETEALKWWPIWQSWTSPKLQLFMGENLQLGSNVEELLDICPAEVLKVMKTLPYKLLLFFEFDRGSLNQTKVQIGSINLIIKPWKPQPMICKIWLGYSHTKKWCKSPTKKCNYCNCGKLYNTCLDLGSNWGHYILV